MTPLMPPASLFLSHGSPTLLIEKETPTHSFLRSLAPVVAQAKALLMVSAHWMTQEVQVGGAATPETIHDFYGFPPALYTIGHPAQGAPEIAAKTAALLRDAGYAATVDDHQGLDHGAWTPLRLMDPDAHLPVFQLSVLHRGSAADHLALGRALSPLTREGVLVIGSGAITHDLRTFRGQPVDAPPEKDTRAFADWIAQRTETKDLEALLNYRAQAPFAQRHHPTDEHLMPFYVALGAAGEGATGTRLHDGTTHSMLAMDAYAFHPAAARIAA
ncbi:DODA-type extradiol aromatic ring-opening family dioxygenase [Rhodospirillum sp. A1_3_36]|uniref:DODA-type extradiol aromatic ring-opening family dioxygenase n=1 Tax=Rhodospirillum sp. A1_3_36 TaxID=3391666 RepID=UPI0039A70CC1